jgi:hypothetical protein
MSTYSKAIGMVMQSTHVEYSGGNSTGNVLFTCGATEKIDFIPQMWKSNASALYIILQFELQIYNAQTNTWSYGMSLGESNHQYPNGQLLTADPITPKYLGLTTANCERLVDGVIKVYPNERIVYNSSGQAGSLTMTYELIKYSST